MVAAQQFRNVPGINHGIDRGLNHGEPQITRMSRFHNLMLRVGQTSPMAILSRDI
ncbi:MAG: hypothetical protein LBG27_04990 [Spirochaetaceae bacterium]|jgi:hypothetical protein|nr:hypothetical protein [Spirochaetaceae bacterium]